MKKFLLSSVFAVTFVTLSACGDDVTEVNEIHQEGIAVLDAGLELSKQKCDAENVGEMLFVTDSAEVFFCDGKTWQTTKGADGKDGVNGLDGENGKDGVGKDGKPGEPGVDGNDGDDGAGCVIVKDSAGVVTLACGEGETADTTTLFKATCGSIVFDPATHFCSEGIVREFGFFEDSRDGQKYRTVKIGSQTWMAQNLNYNPNFLPEGAEDSIVWSWCYNDSAEYCEKYGRLYTWAAAINSVALANDALNPQTCGNGVEDCTLPAVVRGVCPEGWHLPDTTEWRTLLDYVGGQDVAGKMLKSASGWNYKSDGSSGNGVDSYGFAVLPAGYRDYGGDFNAEDGDSRFWSSIIEYSSSDVYAYFVQFDYNNSNVDMDPFHMDFAHSVRCVK